MIYDSHVHTEFSADSKMPLKDASLTANELSLGLTITEHYDYEYGPESAFTFDVDKYFEKYSPLRDKNLLLGIELGLTPQARERNNYLSENYKFDFILGSIHMVDGIDICKDAIFGNPPLAKPLRYLEAASEMIQSFNYIDSLAHIDYFSRYKNKITQTRPKPILYNDFKKQYDEIFNLLKVNQIALELNTSRLHENEDNLSNLKNIYEAYKKAGNKYVTIGSDAHFIEGIGRNFDIAFKFLTELNLTPVYFRDRKMVVYDKEDFIRYL